MNVPSAQWHGCQTLLRTDCYRSANNNRTTLIRTDYRAQLGYRKNQIVLERFIQSIILFLAVCAGLILIPWWAHSSIWATAALVGALLTFGGVLAIQFAFLRQVNRADPAAPASRGQLVRAWWRETAVAALVFLYWQPFRSHKFADQIPDEFCGSRSRGIILVHGFVCNRAIWSRWYPILDAQAIPYCAVNLEPLFGSIDDYVAILDGAVTRMETATGFPPLVVCHSMGGLAVRAWLRATSADARVYRIVTIGSPHHGTSIGIGLPNVSWLVNAEQMRRSSAWLVALAQQEDTARRKKFVCFYSNCDNIVMPTSTATLDDADNRFVDGIAHLAMLLEPKIISGALDLLKPAH